MSYLSVNDKSVGRVQSSLVSKNITIMGRRTSIRLEPEMWEAIHNIADKEGCSIHDICGLVNYRKSDLTSLTAAIRVFLMLYFRAASTDSGHEAAGHGDFINMQRRAGVVDGVSNDCQNYYSGESVSG